VSDLTVVIMITVSYGYVFQRSVSFTARPTSPPPDPPQTAPSHNPTQHIKSEQTTRADIHFSGPAPSCSASCPAASRASRPLRPSHSCGALLGRFRPVQRQSSSPSSPVRPPRSPSKKKLSVILRRAADKVTATTDYSPSNYEKTNRKPPTEKMLESPFILRAARRLRSTVCSPEGVGSRPEGAIGSSQGCDGSSEKPESGGGVAAFTEQDLRDIENGWKVFDVTSPDHCRLLDVTDGVTPLDETLPYQEVGLTIRGYEAIGARGTGRSEGIRRSGGTRRSGGVVEYGMIRVYGAIWGSGRLGRTAGYRGMRRCSAKCLMVLTMPRVHM